MGVELSKQEAEEFLSKESTNRLFPVPGSDRVISWAEVGNTDEMGDTTIPVLVFQGLGGSRFTSRVYHEPALEKGVRIVAVDYPGCGHSTPQHNRTMAEWIRDMDAFTSHVFGEEGRFALSGFSAGGLHALACAADPKLKQRVSSLTLVAPWIPKSITPDPLTLWWKRAGSKLPKFLIGFVGTVLPKSQSMSVNLASPPMLASALGIDELSEGWAHLGKQSVRVSGKAWTDTLKVCLESVEQHDQHLRLEEICADILLVAGGEDKMVSLDLMKWLAAELARKREMQGREGEAVNFHIVEKANHENLWFHDVVVRKSLDHCRNSWTQNVTNASN